MSGHYPDERTIRNSLIERAHQIAGRTGTSVATVSKEAVNDNGFITDVARGRNFTIKSYMRVQTWLDTHWPEDD
jgi:hypothetical protein